MEGARDRQGRVDPIGLPEGIQEGEIHYFILLGAEGGRRAGMEVLRNPHATGVLGRIFVSINSYCRTYLRAYSPTRAYFGGQIFAPKLHSIIIHDAHLNEY